MGEVALLHEEVWFPFSESIVDWEFDFHELLLNDFPRMRAYKEALFAAIRPGDVVVDVGTGTGILALWALQAGAAHVHAIELNTEILQKAQQRLAVYGVEDRCSFYEDISYRVELPEKCDLMISELIGNIGDNEDFLAILSDSRRRFLKDGGRLIPSTVTSYLTPVEASKAHDQIECGTCRVVNRSYDLARLLTERGIKSNFDIYYDVIIPDSAILGPSCKFRDFSFNDNEPLEYSVPLNFNVTRDGVLTGFKGHFVAQLWDNVILDISSDDISNSKVSCSWRHAYFPLHTPLAVRSGDCISAVFSREYPGNKSNFRQVYRWEGEIFCNGSVVGRFSQGMQGSN